MSDPRFGSERPTGLSGKALARAALRSVQLQRKTKRGLDVAVGSLSLFLLLPVLLLVFLLVRYCDGPPAVFRQLRLGQGGRSFDCLKFRTMIDDGNALLAEHLGRDAEAREEWARTHKLADDPRVTPLGRFLRQTSLDELPQLINVLRGEMSLVGPRPILATEVDRYGEAFAICFAAPPGLTGLWQVSGRANLSFDERVELDLAYSISWHLYRDLSILARTVPAVIRQCGSY